MTQPRYPKVAELSKLQASQGFKAMGQNYNHGVGNVDMSGYSVGSAGDINNDGLDDIIIGAPGATSNVINFGYGAGQSYVLFGKRDKWNSTLKLGADSDGFTLEGEAVGDKSGWSVSNTNDINGDGINDLIVGAPFASPYEKFQAGKSYVIFGKPGIWKTTLALSSLNGTNGFVLLGEVAGDQSGFSVSSAGDINNDGIGDLILGAPGAILGAGKSYVIFGDKKLNSSGIFDLSTLNGNNGFIVEGEIMGGQSGYSVSCAGDINDDGISDLIIGMPFAYSFGMTRIGKSFVIFGRHGVWNSTFKLSNLNGTNGFVLNGEEIYGQSGFSVSSVGDVNGDKVSDLIIGAPNASPPGKPLAGKGYVIFGRHGVWNSTFALSNLNGTNGFVLNGEAEGDISGYFVKGAGDINGDGISDFVIGAPHASPPGKLSAGKGYVIFGRCGVWNSTFALSDLDGTNGFVLNGEAMNDEDGVSISGIGDVNGDGINDLIFGVPYASPGISFDNVGAGCSYIITNATNLPPWFVNTTQLTITQGEIKPFLLQNIQANDDWTLNDNLLFTISNLQHVTFTSALGSIFSFTQGDVSNGRISILHDGTHIAPGFDVTVSDGALTTGPIPAIINFTANPNDNNLRNTVIASVGSGLAGVVIFGALFLRYRANKQLEETINKLGTETGNSPSGFQKTVLLPIAKAIFEKIKITGCLNYIDENTTRSYVNAIQIVIEELQKQNVDLDLQKMSTDHQQRLFKEIIKQIRAYTIPQTGICSTRFCNFFKAEVTPVQIEDKANAIASAVAKNINLNTPLLHASNQTEMMEQRSSVSELRR